MAVYEYKCKHCGKVFEVTCHMSEREAKATCPKCGSTDVGQVFSSFSCAPPPKY
jgi:putative FmdB family regulatory protein